MFHINDFSLPFGRPFHMEGWLPVYQRVMPCALDSQPASQNQAVHGCGTHLTLDLH